MAGAKLSSIIKTIYSFKGLEHRLELIGSHQKVNYYNDSFSTTPETAIAALKSFSEPTTIILGGSDKGSDYTLLGKQIINSPHLKTIILIGQMTNKILASINQAGKFNGQIIKNLKTMEEIVSTAHSSSSLGGVVVLSPACASFDMFDNYKHRGESFKAGFSNLKSNHASKKTNG